MKWYEIVVALAVFYVVAMFVFMGGREFFLMRDSKTNNKLINVLRAVLYFAVSFEIGRIVCRYIF